MVAEEVTAAVAADIAADAIAAAAIEGGASLSSNVFEIASAQSSSSAFLSKAGSFALNRGSNYARGRVMGGVLGGPNKPGGAGGSPPGGALVNWVSNVAPIPPIYGSR